MDVEQYMTADVITVTEDTLVVDALNLMEQHDFHRLPVVRDGKLVGLLTERVVLDHSSNLATGRDIHEINYLLTKTRVSQIMKKNVPTIKKNVLLEEAARIMRDDNLHVLPVVDDENHVVGIITYKDIFKAFIDMTGYNDPGSRLVLEIPEDHPGILEDITNILAEANISITHIFVNRKGQFSEITLQVDKESVEEVAELLRYQGYTVLRAQTNPNQ
ncbi:CBS domain-containing protein [Atopococcus tabaci]|uniref:CBS domain-containing protein n=1 Tax=Atopococcus tabaci TaxID=269774 RepID=UPI000420B9FE|nr:CBS domain-containing protein [Atopococcus tabaci]